MAETKKYSGRVGVTNFYYAVLNDDNTIVGEAPERIRFLQNMNIEFAQEISKAHGDNQTAEIAVANGDVNVTTQFHSIPQVDQDIIFGAEVVDGISSYGGDDTPPYIALVCEVTHNDGSSSWLGLPKGKFTRPSEENQTKADGVEFASDSVSGEFMDRDVDGYEKPKSYLKGYEETGSTAVRDALFQKVFGTAFPGTPDPVTPDDTLGE